MVALPRGAPATGAGFLIAAARGEVAVQELFDSLFRSYREYWAGQIEPSVAPTLTNLAVALVILFVAYGAAVRLQRWAALGANRTLADPHYAVLIGRAVRIGVLVLGGLMALGVLGVQPAALVAVLGAISLAISLSVQDVLRNFVAGTYLLMERPFRIGQVIKVKDFTGAVDTVGFRTTTLRTEDNQQVVVPNAVILAEVLVNRDAYGGRIVPPADSDGPPPGAPQTPILPVAPLPPVEPEAPEPPRR